MAAESAAALRRIQAGLTKTNELYWAEQVEIQATAEGRPFNGSEMQDLLALAAAGIRRLTDEQRAVLPVKFSARAR